MLIVFCYGYSYIRFKSSQDYLIYIIYMSCYVNVNRLTPSIEDIYNTDKYSDIVNLSNNQRWFIYLQNVIINACRSYDLTHMQLQSNLFTNEERQTKTSCIRIIQLWQMFQPKRQPYRTSSLLMVTLKQKNFENDGNHPSR